ncbi:hypothetical protein MASR1M101_25660 [Gemmatimonas sp.]
MCREWIGIPASEIREAQREAKWRQDQDEHRDPKDHGATTAGDGGGERLYDRTPERYAAEPRPRDHRTHYRRYRSKHGSIPQVVREGRWRGTGRDLTEPGEDKAEDCASDRTDENRAKLQKAPCAQGMTEDAHETFR